MAHAVFLGAQEFWAKGLDLCVFCVFGVSFHGDLIH